MKLELRSKKKRSQLSERQLARQLKGRVQPASGAINRYDLKGDVLAKNFLLDDKVTGAGSFSVSVKLMEKLRTEAFRNRRRAALRVHFEGTPARKFFVISEADFFLLNEAINQGLE